VNVVIGSAMPPRSDQSTSVDHAHEAVAVADQEVVELALGHHRRRLAEARVRGRGHQVRAHELVNLPFGCGVRADGFRDRPGHVPIGDYADQALAVADGDRLHAPLGHRLGGGADRVGRPDSGEVTRHDI